MGYVKSAGIKYTAVGINNYSYNYSCSLFDRNSYPLISMVRCSAAKKKCITCNNTNSSTQPAEVPNIDGENEANETDSYNSSNMENSVMPSDGPSLLPSFSPTDRPK